jgi:hypothetical protein
LQFTLKLRNDAFPLRSSVPIVIGNVPLSSKECYTDEVSLESDAGMRSSRVIPATPVPTEKFGFIQPNKFHCYFK